MQLRCETCGKSRVKVTGKQKRINYRFCSQRCRRDKGRKMERVDRWCRECKKEFVGIANQFYCSEKCQRRKYRT